MKITIIFTILLFLFFTTYKVRAQKELKSYGKLIPTDQTQFNNSFSEFKSQIILAIHSRDADLLRKFISPNIKVNEYQEEQNNIGFFLEKYNLDDTNCIFWNSMSKLISLGGDYSEYDSSFNFPSLGNTDLYGKIFGEDWYMNFGTMENKRNIGSAVSENIIVYDSDDIKSNILGYLNFEIVLINNFEYDKYQSWYKIQLKNGDTGYVQSKDLYLAIADYYCSFKKIDGNWYLTAFDITGI